MNRYDSDFTETSKKTKHKNPKFRDYYDEEFNEQEEKELQQRRKKLDKNSKMEKESRPRMASRLMVCFIYKGNRLSPFFCDKPPSSPFYLEDCVCNRHITATL